VAGGTWGGYRDYRIRRDTPPDGQNEAGEQVRSLLWQSCRKPELNGACVRLVGADRNRLFINGSVDSDSQKAVVHQEVQWILRNHSELQNKFPRGIVDVSEHQLQVYPVRETLRRWQSAAGNGPDGIQVVVRLANFYYEDNKLHLVGAGFASGPAAGDGQKVRSWLAEVVKADLQKPGHTFLGDQLEVVAEESKFPVYPSPLPSVMKAVAEEKELGGVVVGTLHFDDEGRAVVQVILAKDGQSKKAEEVLRKSLATSPGIDLVGDPVFKTFDVNEAKAETRQLFAKSLDWRNGVLAEGVRVAYDPVRLLPVVSWNVTDRAQGVKDLKSALRTETSKFLKDLKSASRTETSKFPFDFDVDALSDSGDKDGTDFANELQALVDEDRQLSGLIVLGFHFNDAGALDIDVSPAGTGIKKREALYKLARIVPGLEGILAKAPAEQQDEKKDQVSSINDAIQAELAADPLLSHVHVTGFTWKRDLKEAKANHRSWKPRVSGKSLLPAKYLAKKGGGELSKLLEGKLKIELLKHKTELRVDDIAGVNLEDSTTFKWAEKAPELHDWQKKLNQRNLYGVLLLDVYFLGDGSLQALALIDDKDQKEPVQRALSDLAGASVTIQLFTGLARDSAESRWHLLLQKALFNLRSNEGGLFGRTRVDRTEWEHDSTGNPRLIVHCLCVQPYKDEKEAELFRNLLQPTVKASVATALTGLRKNQADRMKDVPIDPNRHTLDGPPFTTDPEVEVRLNLLPNPVFALRDKAVGDETLHGAAFVDHYFDDQGVLQLVGLVRDDKQRDQIRETVGKALPSQADAKPQSPSVLARSMKGSIEDRLLVQLQSELTSGTIPYSRTRLDHATFRYHAPADKSGGEPKLHLHFGGVCMTDSSADLTAVNEFLDRKKDRVIQCELGFAVESRADAEDIKYDQRFDPLNAVQSAVNNDPATEGVLVRNIGFNEKGEFQLVLALADSPKMRAHVNRIADELPTLTMYKRLATSSTHKTADVAENADVTGVEHDSIRTALSTISKKLANSNRQCLRCVRIEGLRWSHEKDGLKLAIRGQALGLAFMERGATVTVEQALRSILTEKLVPHVEELARHGPLGIKGVVLRDDQFHSVPDSPLVALQGQCKDKLPGALFTEIYYTSGGDVELGARVASSDEEAAVRAIAGTTAGLANEYLGSSNRVTIHITKHAWNTDTIKNWSDVLMGIRSSLIAGGPVANQTRLRGAYFAYDQDRTNRALSLRIVLQGVCLVAESENNLALKLGNIVNPWVARDPLPSTYDDTPDVRQVTHFDAVRGLQSQIADDPKLDGTAIAEAHFDNNDVIVFRGVIGDEATRPAIAQLGERTFAAGLDQARLTTSVSLELLRGREILEGLREFAAYNLDEVWVERLFFDAGGELTVNARVAHVADQKVILRHLMQAIARHPQFQGRTRASEFIPRAKPAEPAREPTVRVTVRDAVIPVIRNRFQGPRDANAPAPPKEWDGLLIRRAYYTTTGMLGLEGLANGAEQKSSLERQLLLLASEKPFSDCGAQTVDLTGLREMPVEPMLVRLRKLMPAYRVFDGFTLDRAYHDVDNRLIVSYSAVGSPDCSRGDETIWKQMAGDRRSQMRVDETWLRLRQPDGHGGQLSALRSLAGKPARPRDRARADDLVLEAIAALRRGLPRPVFPLCVGCCERVEPIREGHDEQAIAEALHLLDVALLHSPGNATAWYLRALCHLASRNTLLSARDLRRLVELETDSESGENEKLERLTKSESLQGDIRHQLETLRTRVELEVKSGRQPLQLVDLN
jgi:hypothetical protein